VALVDVDIFDILFQIGALLPKQTDLNILEERQRAVLGASGMSE
jgi:hypothetical protein